MTIVNYDTPSLFFYPLFGESKMSKETLTRAEKNS
mgnify:CR=1 FL=1